jgi:hypothetical protein
VINNGRYDTICVTKDILTSFVVSLPFLMSDLGWMRCMMLSVVLVVCGAMSAGNFLVCSKTKVSSRQDTPIHKNFLSFKEYK